ncbi:hypothetical protein KHC33_15300 [Methanospirillum sp. J.3.6.1-F.2.7.3]|uniref:Uncharacterized protein n=1 Tax=Methanospirillum purgamenti TaxID=2834276 RepID=A0A8E7EJI8_9EURY|nr:MULTISPECIES: hypothetical protein [Methanospirillum]MDX8548979.1 hypothetical protein [Methanospirillum hungatei]QVV88666.1 hypothetical protein KHC33_15300 [Methanospirillum sp. J.3.6.1-F.2.7.3]
MSQVVFIREAASILCREGQVVELRTLGERTHYGYYTDFDKLARDAAVLDTTPGISGIYITINEVNPALLSRCANRIKKSGQKEPQTADGDIIRRKWLPIDIDPVRPSGISSSEAEHQAALKKAESIAAFLKELGWPDPVTADSGNGAHLLYRIDLPSDPKSTTLIRDCLKTLGQFFSDDQSAIDITVSNPARIWKLYGTRSRKGDHTPDRPHRTSHLTRTPETIHQVSDGLLQALASLYEPPESENPDLSHKGGKIPAIDLGDWLTTHGFAYTEKPYQSGRLFVFAECPFSTAHKDGAYAIQFANGAIFAGCHHHSCGGSTQRWQELKNRYDTQGNEPKPDYETRIRRRIQDRAQIKAIRDGYGSEPKGETRTTFEREQEENPGFSEEQDIHEEVTRIVHKGDPITYLVDTFARRHEGDEIVAKCLLMSLASRSVVNSKGLHVLVTGESGKGKSHAFETMLDLIPEEYRLSGRMSDKALFYLKDLRKGSVICMDDVSLSTQMQETLKGVTTSFREPFIYRTVDKDRNCLTRIIPERCLWWIAKVEGTGDDQIWNRMLTTWIDDSQKQDDRVLARELAAAAKPASVVPDLTREMRICRAIWNKIDSVSVVIPYAERIRFTNSKNRRNSSMLLDLIRSIAVMNQYQRERREIHGIVEIVARKEDFEQAKEIYLKLNGESGGQLTKLTSIENMLVQAIRTSGKATITVKEMQKMINRSQSTISRILAGNPDKVQYQGLLEKCPPLSFYDRSELAEDGGYRRGRVYTWDHEMDEQWSAGVLCWLDEPNDDRRPGPGDDMDLCTPMHDLCTKECIQTAEGPSTISENNHQELDSSGAMQTSDHESTSLGDEPTMTPVQVHHAYQDHESENNMLDLINTNNTSDTSMHSGTDNACIAVHSMNTSKGLEQDRGKQDERLLLPDIDPYSFLMVERMQNRVCDSCGNKGVRYRERGLSRPGEKEQHMICERCYSAAVSRQVLSIRAIPGILPLGTMVKTDRSLGRCHLCNLHPITRLDEETKIGLCESCYYREKWSNHSRAGEKS